MSPQIRCSRYGYAGQCRGSPSTSSAKTADGPVARRGLKGRVRANAAGCLDQCEHGPTVVVYPDGVWYGRVTAADVEEIIESHIVNGKPIERLMIADECLNASECPHRVPKPQR